MVTRTDKLDSKGYLLIFRVTGFGQRRTHWVRIECFAYFRQGSAEGLSRLGNVERHWSLVCCRPLRCAVDRHLVVNTVLFNY